MRNPGGRGRPFNTVLIRSVTGGPDGPSVARAERAKPTNPQGRGGLLSETIGLTYRIGDTILRGLGRDRGHDSAWIGDTILRG